MRFTSRGTLGLLAVAAVLGCKDNTGIYPGGPAGAAAGIEVSDHDIVVVAGQPKVIGAQLIDAAGNPVADAVTMTPCSGGVVSVATAAATSGAFGTQGTVTASSLGVSCVEISGGGITDSVRVTTGPAGILIDGPAMVGSGNTAAYTAVPVDAAGAAMTGSTEFTWTSSNTARLVIHPHTGAVGGRSTGAATVRLRAPGGATATFPATVVAGTFEGTLSASTGSPGAMITATRAAGMEPWDANSGVRLAGRAGFVDRFTADELFFVVPPTGATTSQTLSLFNIGPSEISQESSFTPTSATGHTYQPSSDACATAPDFDANASPGGWVYFTVTDASVGWGGPNPDTWFAVSAGATDRTVDARLEWTVPIGTTPYADLDLYIYDACGGAVVDGSAAYNPPQGAFEEVTDLVIPAGETYYFQARTWDDQGSITSGARLRIQ